MTFKQFKQKKYVRFIGNKYFIILIFFLIWMMFFDENSYLNHRELNMEIEKLEDANEYYESETKKDSKDIYNLNHPDSLEKYAREEYRMKKENEDIFIIEYDTVEKK